MSKQPWKPDEKRFPNVYQDFAFGKWSDHIHGKRWKAGLSTRQMGKIVGKSASMISRWERRLSIPTVPDFLFICKYFDLDPCAYLKLDQPQTKTEFMFEEEGQ